MVKVHSLKSNVSIISNRPLPSLKFISYRHAGSLSYSHTILVHQVPITAGQAEAVWNEKFTGYFYQLSESRPRALNLESNALSTRPQASIALNGRACSSLNIYTKILQFQLTMKYLHQVMKWSWTSVYQLKQIQNTSCDKYMGIKKNLVFPWGIIILRFELTQDISIQVLYYQVTLLYCNKYVFLSNTLSHNQYFMSSSPSQLTQAWK